MPSSRLTTLAFAVSAAALFGLNAPAKAGPAQHEYSSIKSNTDLSAAKKKKSARKVRVYPDYGLDYYARRGIVPSMGYIGPPGYPGEYAWRKSIGQCVVDMGYGRWSSCDSP